MAGKEAVTGKSHSRENGRGRFRWITVIFDSLAVVLPEDIEKLKWRGEFDRAVRRIDSRLEKDIPQL